MIFLRIAEDKRINIVEMLLRVDPPSTIQSILYQVDDNEMTALHSACMMGATEVVICLHKNGIDAFSRDAGGWTPFIYALYREQVDCVLVLLGISKQKVKDEINLLDVLKEERGENSSRVFSKSTIENAFRHLSYLGKLVNERGNDDSILNDVLESLATVPEFFQIVNQVMLDHSSDVRGSLSFLASMPFLMNTRNKMNHISAIVRSIYGNRLEFPILTSPLITASVYLPRKDPWAGFLSLIEEDSLKSEAKISFTDDTTEENYDLQFHRLDKMSFLLQNRIIFQFDGRLENGIGVGVEREVSFQLFLDK